LEEGVTRKIFFLLSSSDWQGTLNALPAFEQALSACDCIAAVSARQNVDNLVELQQHYQKFASVLLSEKDRVLLEEEQGQVLIEAALQELMANPASLSTADLMGDPLSTLDDYLASLQRQTSGRGAIEEGYIYFDDANADRRYLLVAAEIASSPYGLDTQSAVHEATANAQSRFTEAVQDPDIVQTGVFFYARAGTEQARAEISTIGLGSLVGIIVIFLLVFRSVGLLLLAMVPTGAGVVAGLVLCQLIFGSVHVIALVFGASLIGVSIDYSLHFLCKRQAMGPGWQPRVGLRRVIVGLSLGLLTTTAGYLGFAIAGFPGFKQVAVFSCAGLIMSYMVVAGFYPWILRSPGAQMPPQYLRLKLTAYLAAARRYLPWIKRPEIAAPLVAIAIGGLWQLQMLDDIRAMQLPNPELGAQEARFREVVGQVTAMQYLLVEGDTPEALLQKLEQLQAPLQKAQTAGAIDGFVNLATWLPSRATQQDNNALVLEQLIDKGLLKTYLDTLGVKEVARAQIMDTFTRPAADFLTIDNTVASLEKLLRRPLHFSDGGKHYSLVLLENLHKARSLQKLADANDKVLWVDRVATTNQLLQQYRESASLVLGCAYAVILFLLSLRYGLRGALAVIMPPLLASLFVLVVFGWFGIGLSVFNIVALLLVLGIGIDSTLFLRESGGRGYDTLFAVCLSTLTTLLSFGLLALSATHAIYSFGLTVLLGIVMSFILAPLSIKPVPSQ
jgi:predicted exporter